MGAHKCLRVVRSEILDRKGCRLGAAKCTLVKMGDQHGREQFDSGKARAGALHLALLHMRLEPCCYSREDRLKMVVEISLADLPIGKTLA